MAYATIEFWPLPEKLGLPTAVGVGTTVITRPLATAVYHRVHLYVLGIRRCLKKIVPMFLLLVRMFVVLFPSTAGVAK